MRILAAGLSWPSWKLRRLKQGLAVVKTFKTHFSMSEPLSRKSTRFARNLRIKCNSGFSIKGHRTIQFDAGDT